MAVTVAQLWVAVNLGDENTPLNPEISARLTTLLGVAQARVDKASASNTPDEIKDEAITRMVWIFERSTALVGERQRTGVRLSPLVVLLPCLAPWRRRRALHIGDLGD